MKSVGVSQINHVPYVEWTEKGNTICPWLNCKGIIAGTDSSKVYWTKKIWGCWWHHNIYLQSKCNINGTMLLCATWFHIDMHDINHIVVIIKHTLVKTIWYDRIWLRNSLNNCINSWYFEWDEYLEEKISVQSSFFIKYNPL